MRIVTDSGSWDINLQDPDPYVVEELKEAGFWQPWMEGRVVCDKCYSAYGEQLCCDNCECGVCHLPSK